MKKLKKALLFVVISALAFVGSCSPAPEKSAETTQTAQSHESATTTTAEIESAAVPQIEENSDREIIGLDFEPLNPSDAIFGQWSNYSFTFDAFTYAIKYDGKTYTSKTAPERFDENFQYTEEEQEKGDLLYRKINSGDQIGETEVTECSYTCESFESREGTRTEPFRAALTLSGTVTLKGVIVCAEEGDDYWNIYADTVLFFPYADSLKESRIPLLHTEQINAVYYENGKPIFGFYGETLPFELGNSKDLFNGESFAELMGSEKIGEATIRFEEIVQSWMYMNASGWNPCGAKIAEIEFATATTASVSDLSRSEVS